MNKKIGFAVIVGTMGFASVASAQDSGFEVGARVGYGIPLGDATGGPGDTGMSDFVSGQIPLQLDLGYRLDPQLMLGAYFTYGVGFPGSDFCDDVDCSASGMRLGVQAQYHFAPITTDGAWLGAGIGYEWGTMTVADTDISMGGFEFLNVQGGYDFNVAEKFRVGPYALISLAQYSSGSSGDQDMDIDDKALHSWLMFGVKGTFGAL